MTKEEWLDRFVMYLCKMVVRAEPHHFDVIAEECYLVYLPMEPEEAAQIEFFQWLPHDD
ncbi:MAG: hypothetical protein ABI939_12765 [Anaerolineaceae bacterium]